MGAHVEQLGTDEPRKFVVTTFGSRPEPGKAGRLVLTSGIWDGMSPYGLGYPFRWALERTDGGAQIRRIEGRAEELIARPLREISAAELSGERAIELDPSEDLWITLQPVTNLREMARQKHPPAWVPKPLQVAQLTNVETDRFFRLAAVGVLIASLAGLAGLSLLSVKKTDSELIPPQFAKILLQPAFKMTPSKAKAVDGKAARDNVVQVMRSQAVQKTVRGLLNPSAAKSLLSRTSLLNAGSARQALRGVFEGHSSLSQKTGIDGIDMKDVGRGMPTTGVSQRGDYRGGAASSTAGGGTGLAAISYESIGVSEGLTKDEVGKVIREHVGEIRYCYEAALARSPGLEGKLLVTFTVDGSGAVKDVQAKESSGNPGLDRCIQNRLLKWTFPKPRQGVDIGVTYPFIFKSLAD